MFPPERIVCLTEETVETLYLLGEQDRIVGISGYCVRPPEARQEKPRVSAFTSANVGKILDLRPDLVLSFSDLQADIVGTLIRQGIAVHAFNQRTIAEILDMIRLLGALVGADDRAKRLAEDLLAGIAEARQQAKQLRKRPRVYFEEWDEPMISGIAWVSELIEIAGGTDIFVDRAAGKSAKERMVTFEEVISRRPDVVIGSWCGKKFRPEKVAARPVLVAVGGAAALDFKPPEKAAGNTLRQTVVVRQGVGADLARRLIRELKDKKLKVQAAMQGEELRITGKKRDDLQAAIAVVRGLKLDQPLQYLNFRE